MTFIFGQKKYTDLVKEIPVFSSLELIKAFSEAQLLKEDYFVCVYIKYEGHRAFFDKNYKEKTPFAYFAFFQNEETFTAENVQNILVEQQEQITHRQYLSAIKKIKNQIKEGNTYQVNFTYEKKIFSNIPGYKLFCSILKNQHTPYCAYIKNNFDEILSFSPELFFKKENKKLITKPMKGTIKRGKTKQEDEKRINFLKNDSKNNAENIMIVDLLRNDLGIISRFDSIRAEKIFEIETYKTLHQMTSTITSTLKEGVKYYDIFKALFPCGSITGAPKLSTINIINTLETGKRDIYCGAIGIIHKDCAQFSVPIRTLCKKTKENDYSLRVGGGIVWDSKAHDEWEETRVKSAFLNCSFELFETILAKNKEFIYFREHLNRLQKSARILGFKYNKDIEQIKPQKDAIYKIILYPDGNFEVKTRQYKNIQTNLVQISKIKLNSSDLFLKYKTTNRPIYNEASKIIEEKNLFDIIFFNQKDELCEGSRANIILEINGTNYTPPQECGLLNGVLREKLLKEGKIKEKILYLNDLHKAQNIYLINSVRGIKKVQILDL